MLFAFALNCVNLIKRTKAVKRKNKNITSKVRNKVTALCHFEKARFKLHQNLPIIACYRFKTYRYIISKEKPAKKGKL